MNKRIVFTGPSGTGKTTWAKHIEEKFGIKYISLAGGALWSKYKIENHTDVINRSLKDPLWGFEYEMELLKLREKVYTENESFVSDRSSICNTVYALLHISHVISKEHIEEILDYGLKLHSMVDATIYLPFSHGLYTEENPKRVLNPYYQLTTDAVFEKIITEWYTPNFPEGLVVGIRTSDRDERSLAIDDIIQSLKPKSLIITP